jgi:hypothetical protein
MCFPIVFTQQGHSFTPQSLHLYVNNYKVVSAFLKSQVAYINSYIVVVQLLWYIMVYGLLSEHWSDYFSPSHRIYLLPYSQLLNMYSMVVMRLVRDNSS